MPEATLDTLCDRCGDEKAETEIEQRLGPTLELCNGCASDWAIELLDEVQQGGD